jgi:hypothetical protein
MAGTWPVNGLSSGSKLIAHSNYMQAFMLIKYKQEPGQWMGRFDPGRREYLYLDGSPRIQNCQPDCVRVYFD